MTVDNATRAVDAIIKDLSDRGGLDGAWNDVDSEMQDEIREIWAQAIRAEYDK
jgi:hypothetical protein